MILRTLRRRSLDSHEATANVVIGLGINWSLLVAFYGGPEVAAGVSAVAFVLTWVRSYAIRRTFRWLGERRRP